MKLQYDQSISQADKSESGYSIVNSMCRHQVKLDKTSFEPMRNNWPVRIDQSGLNLIHHNAPRTVASVENLACMAEAWVAADMMGDEMTPNELARTVQCVSYLTCRRQSVNRDFQLQMPQNVKYMKTSLKLPAHMVKNPTQLLQTVAEAPPVAPVEQALEMPVKPALAIAPVEQAQSSASVEQALAIAPVEQALAIVPAEQAEDSASVQKDESDKVFFTSKVHSCSFKGCDFYENGAAVACIKSGGGVKKTMVVADIGCWWNQRRESRIPSWRCSHTSPECTPSRTSVEPSAWRTKRIGRGR